MAVLPSSVTFKMYIPEEMVDTSTSDFTPEKLEESTCLPKRLNTANAFLLSLLLVIVNVLLLTGFG